MIQSRREFIRWSAVGIAAGVRSDPVAAQEAAPAPQFRLDAYSRNLQWLRGPGDLAEGVTDLGLNSVDLTVAPYPGHVDPEKVKTDLPSFVAALKRNGIATRAITCAITDADSPNAEAILDAAAGAGVARYSWSGFTYDQKQPYKPQLDALKPRVEKLVKLNQKYGMKALYQPKFGIGNVGALFVDFLDVLQNFDPDHAAFRYDTGAMMQVTSQQMTMHLHMGAPYIGGVALNDGAVELDLPTWNQGPLTGDIRDLTAPSGSGDNTGNAGGNPLAIGGGGRPLPYHYKVVPVGTGMLDLTLLGQTLKDIGFKGPAETQIAWPLGGVETGSDRITLPRQAVIGLMKRDRLIVEQAFRTPWHIDVLLPPFMRPGFAPRQRGGPPPG